MGPTNNKIKVSIKIITYTYPKERKKKKTNSYNQKNDKTIVRAKEKKNEQECGQERVKRQLERKYYPG